MLTKLTTVVCLTIGWYSTQAQGLGAFFNNEYKPRECNDKLKRFGDGQCYDLQRMYSGSYFWFGHDSTFTYIFYGEGTHSFGAGSYYTKTDTLYLTPNADYAKHLIETGVYQDESYVNPKYARIIKSQSIICTPTENGGYRCKF